MRRVLGIVAQRFSAPNAEHEWCERLSPIASSARNADDEMSSLTASACIVAISYRTRVTNRSRSDVNRFTKAGEKGAKQWRAENRS
ncbi:MAG: hypothetical protein Q8N16_01415 [bacterium]|nr:hypothetical protein [bacterium]